MDYASILSLLGQFNLFSWVIAACVSLVVFIYVKHKGWLYVMIGSFFIVLRQKWKLLPSYDGNSEILFNTYMMRYILGAAGVICLLIGFGMLWLESYETLRDAKSKPKRGKKK